MNDLQWVIEPKYDDIVVYGQQSFVVKENGIYKVLDYQENTLHEFTNKEKIEDHPNEGGELQELIHVRIGEKTKLFNIKSLNYIHEGKYYLLQTDYYDSERRLIRVFDELKEGVMDFDGNMILPPLFKSVVVAEDFNLGFKENEILIFNQKGEVAKELPYSNKGAQFLEKRHVLKAQKKVEGDANIYNKVRKYENGVNKVIFEKSGTDSFVSGIVDINNSVVIPFIYSSIYVKSDEYLQVAKEAKITDKGFVIQSFNPKVGIIDFENNEILPINYKYIGVIEGGYVQVENFENKRAVFNLEERKFETEFIFNSYGEAAQAIAKLDASKEVVQFKDKGLIGLKNKMNEVLIPANYSGISSTFNPDIYIVNGASDDEFGYQGYYNIRLNKEIIPTIFADRGGIGGHKKNNQNNVISVMDPETGEIGFYKIDGTKISDVIFDEGVEGFSEDLAPVYKDFSEKTGMIDINGEVVHDFIFDSMTLPYDAKSIVKYKGKVGILNLKNN